MSRKAFVILTLVLICGSTYWLGLTRGADGPKAAAPAEDDPFAGKVLVISSKSSTQYGAQIEDVRLRKIGDQMFLVGTSYYSDDTVWSHGRPTTIPLNDVAQIVEFDTREDLNAARGN